MRGDEDTRAHADFYPQVIKTREEPLLLHFFEATRSRRASGARYDDTQNRDGRNAAKGCARLLFGIGRRGYLRALVLSAASMAVLMIS